MEEKRRLPSWIISGSTTNNKVSKSFDADTSSVITSDETSGMTNSTKPRAKGVARNCKKDIGISSGENVLVKCETKRKKRRGVEKDVIECREIDQEVNVEKRKRARVKRKDEELDTSRKKNKKSYDFDSGDETQDLSCDDDDDDDDDDLTMDDVLSIAKEFVEKDKSDTGQQKSAQVQCELRSESSYVRSPKMQEKDYYYHEPVETTSKVTLRSPKMQEEKDHYHEPIESTLADSVMTGDPAQDMLDLFLGPLLKKPIAKAETSSIKGVVVPHETKKQQHPAVVSSKPVTFTKKKSSLRDAVAMLLD
ncbi:uncharacterized protein LOC143539926 [Bidens hawaiensis]|uniref:uncharacterized protein LOC143539926 n=1 Tax=Bidens hawaiensis TaxID=980011 RepID=UPI00404AFFB2